MAELPSPASRRRLLVVGILATLAATVAALAVSLVIDDPNPAVASGAEGTQRGEPVAASDGSDQADPPVTANVAAPAGGSPSAPAPEPQVIRPSDGTAPLQAGSATNDVPCPLLAAGEARHYLGDRVQSFTSDDDGRTLCRWQVPTDTGDGAQVTVLDAPADGPDDRGYQRDKATLTDLFGASVDPLDLAAGAEVVSTRTGATVRIPRVGRVLFVSVQGLPASAGSPRDVAAKLARLVHDGRP
jgi:hypothetical protein